ncbi:MAG: tRNA dihydrouridine synthase [Kofleriaceae bacterium]
MRELLARSPVVLAPMEDVSDVAFRRACRSVGAELCVTEFVHVDQIIHDSRIARRKLALASDDRPTAIQIYGADPQRLLAAAQIAERAEPAFLDLNCGCWIPRIANKGAGAGWLRDPEAMIAMAAAIVRAVAIPVTVKTRIGWGPESDMPIVDLARRLEDVGVAAITIHCRTALAGHTGPADWTWAARAREVVQIPVVVNGDVRTADDVVRALDETRCAAAMIGRGAIDHPWVFREAHASLRGERISPPTDEERRAMFAMITAENVAQRGERVGVGVARRHAKVLGDQATALRPRLFAARSLDEVRDVLGA